MQEEKSQKAFLKAIGRAGVTEWAKLLAAT